MPIRIILITLFLVSLSYTASAQLDWLKGKINSIKDTNVTSLKDTKLSDTKIGQGLKEALKVGITNAVQSTGKTDGFLKNEAIKILMPEKLKNFEKALRAVGYGNQLDQFVLSMNRAAEKATPAAQSIFLDSIFNMSFDDVQKIYSGGNSAATDYLKKSTYDQLIKAFQPAVNNALKEYDVTNKYKTLVDKYRSLPLTKNFPAPDIDQYVITKSLDGLFHVLGQEEQKIRTDPSARVTNLLKEVFK